MVRELIIKEVEGKMVSVKVDGASKSHRHFVGINIQLCIDGMPAVRTLAIEEMLTESSGPNLKSLIFIVLKRFKIEPKQLVSFTSDSGANYNAAGRLLDLPEEDLAQEGEETDLFDNIEDSSWTDADMELVQVCNEGDGTQFPVVQAWI